MADQGIGHAWTSPVHGSCGGLQDGAAGGALGAGIGFEGEGVEGRTERIEGGL